MAHTFHRYSFSSTVFSLRLHSSLFAVEPIDFSATFNIDLFSNPRVNFDLLFHSQFKGLSFQMASSQTQGETRHRGIDFLTTQRDKAIPVIDGYIFIAKDRGRKRFSCRTRTCHASVRILVDEIGPYYTGVPVHDHPAHAEVVNELKHRQELRVASRAKESQAVPTQQVVVDVRLKTASTRRISTDARFVRRVRQNGHAPKKHQPTLFLMMSSKTPCCSIRPTMTLTSSGRARWLRTRRRCK